MLDYWFLAAFFITQLLQNAKPELSLSLAQPHEEKQKCSWMLFLNMRVSVSLAPMPEERVAVSRVLVLGGGLILAMNLESSPSSAITQITRNIGNIAPSKQPGRKTRIYCIYINSPMKHT